MNKMNNTNANNKNDKLGINEANNIYEEKNITSINRKITIDEVNHIMGLPSYVKNEQQQKEMKFALLDTIQEALSEDWYGLRTKTQQAIQYMCFLSADRGYFYAKPETIAKKCKIGKSTVYGILGTLMDKHLVTKVNRQSRRHNGLGNAVYILTQHPYFESIINYLSIEWKPEWKANWKAEGAETPYESKCNDVKSPPTYSLPTFSTKVIKSGTYKCENTEIEKNTHEVNKTGKTVKKIEKEGDGRKNENNVYDLNEVKVENLSKWYKYVPRTINSIFARTFGDNLVTFWKKVKFGIKYSKPVQEIDKGHEVVLATTVFRNLMNHANYVRMSVDEMSAYIYRGIVSSVQELNRIENDRIDMEREEQMERYENTPPEYGKDHEPSPTHLQDFFKTYIYGENNEKKEEEYSAVQVSKNIAPPFPILYGELDRSMDSESFYELMGMGSEIYIV